MKEENGKPYLSGNTGATGGAMKLHERLAWIFATTLPPTAKSVLIVLACQADKEERCWPRQSIIASKSGLSRHAVVNTFKLLRKVKSGDSELPIIQENRRWHRSTIYTLNFQCSPSELLGVHQVNKKRTVQRTLRKSRKKKPATHVAGLPVCPKCKVRPSASGDDSPCLNCIRDDRKADKRCEYCNKPSWQCRGHIIGSTTSSSHQQA